jgi:predicted Zn-dependent peptidase
MLKTTVLKNGLTVMRLPRPGNIVTVGFVVHSGCSVEFGGNCTPGLSHLTERLFWCGTDKHPSRRQLNRALESMGGNYYSLTNQEFSEYYITVPAEHQFKAISMMAEIIQHSHFDERDIENEKQFVIERARAYETDSGFDFSPLAVSNIYQGYGYSMPVYGEMETVMAINRDEIMDYLARQYLPQNSSFVIAGNIDGKQTTDLINQEWSFWNPKPKQTHVLKRFPVEDVRERLPSVVYRQRGLPETQIICGFLLDEGSEPRIFRETSPEAQATLDMAKVTEKNLNEWAHYLLLNTILGQGLSSRLWLKGVEEEMLFDKVFSQLIRFSRSSYLQIQGTADNNQFTFALESILATLDQLKKTPVSINEITKAKEALKGRIIMEHEDLLTATVWQVENLVASTLTFEVSDILDKVKNIDAPSLRMIANSLFCKDRFFLTTLGTAKETSIVDKLIAKYL